MKAILIFENERILGAVQFPKDKNVKIIFLEFIMEEIQVESLEFSKRTAKVLSKKGDWYTYRYEVIPIYSPDEI